MKLSEARKILGLGPDEDPRPHLVEFRSARERIAELVRSAPNETLGDRYQQGLVEFDKALAAVREYLEALGLVERTDPATHKSPPPRPNPNPRPSPSRHRRRKSKKRSSSTSTIRPPCAAARHRRSFYSSSY